MKKGKIIYDKEHDILILKIREGVYEKSTEKGNLVIDKDKKGSIMGIRVLDASFVLGIDKSAINTNKMEVEKNNEAIYIKLREGEFDRNEIVDDFTILDLDKDSAVLG